MLKIIAIVLVAGFFTLSSAGAAEARLFEPQAHWYSSGRTCVASRGPAARRWDAMPPRACRTEAPQTQTQIVVALDEANVRKLKARNAPAAIANA